MKSVHVLNECPVNLNTTIIVLYEKDKAEWLTRVSKDAIEMRQKKGGHSCQRTFLKGHIYWERCNVPKGQTIGNRFLHVSSLTDIPLQYIFTTCTSVDSRLPQTELPY